MPSNPEKKLFPPRFSKAVKERLLVSVGKHAEELTIMLEGLDQNLAEHIISLRNRIRHNGKAHNQDGYTLHDIMQEIYALEKYAESVKTHGPDELLLTQPVSDTKH